MLYTLRLLADAAEKAPTTTTPNPGSPLDFMPLLFGMFALFYFLVLRPQRKEAAERQALLTSIKKNDKIITHAGIYGTIVSVSEKEDEIVVKVDDNVRIKMLKASIMRNLTNEEAAKEAKEAKDKPPEKAAEDKNTNVTTKT